MIMSSLRNRVAEQRTARGWSQQELARRSGLSRTAVSAIEIARVAPSTTAALALAAAFDCRVEDLFSLHHAAAARSQSQWAWQPRSDPSQLWRVAIATRTLLYPTERTAVGLLPPDGVLRAGTLELNHRVDPARTLIVAGCDPAIGLLRAEVMRSGGIEVLPLIRSSRQALDLLRQDLVHVAGVHLQDRAAPAGNKRAVRELVGPGYTLLRVTRWQEGVVLAPNLRLRTVKEAVSSKLRWVVREPGSGARHCLDELFRGRRHAVPQFDHVASDHQAVAETIRTGWAEAGVCVRLCAAEAGLDFLAAREEDYDLCYRSDRQDDPRIQALFNAVRSHAFQSAMAALPGYSATQTGEQLHV